MFEQSVKEENSRVERRHDGWWGCRNPCCLDLIQATTRESSTTIFPINDMYIFNSSSHYLCHVSITSASYSLSPVFSSRNPRHSNLLSGTWSHESATIQLSALARREKWIPDLLARFSVRILMDCDSWLCHSIRQTIVSEILPLGCVADQDLFMFKPTLSCRLWRTLRKAFIDFTLDSYPNR